MNFLRKILLVAVAFVFVENAEGAQTIFDLPDNTPGLMKDKQIQKVCDQDKECVHVIVPESEADKVFLLGNSADDEQEAIESAKYKSGNLYFSTDGTQPTTPEAAEYSCANVDNTLNSPITDWYMKMFGVIDKHGGTSSNDDDYIKAGGDGNNVSLNTRPIVMFDLSVDGTMVSDPDIRGPSISRRVLFERKFREIASNPVGRVLLYRILIEIRRHNGTFAPVLEQNQNIITLDDLNNILPTLAQYRNNGRHILITWDSNEVFGFTRSNQHYQGNSNINFNLTPCVEQIVFKFDNNQVLIERMMSNLSADLFHEILHWFHNLRDPLRFSLEEIGNNALGKKVCLNDFSCVGGYFYKGSQSNDAKRRKISTLPWGTKRGTNFIVNFEEMRNILGAPRILLNSPYYYLEGDDISENVFRLSLDLYMRFGHKDFSYLEDENFVLSAKTLAESSYFLITGKTRIFQIFKGNNISGSYPIAGLSASKFPDLGVTLSSSSDKVWFNPGTGTIEIVD